MYNHNQMNYSFNVGGARIDTRLQNTMFVPGDLVQGQVLILGGGYAQEIGELFLQVCTLYNLKKGYHKADTAEIARFKLSNAVAVQSNQQISIPFQFQLPFNTPTTIYGGDTRVWLRTKLDTIAYQDPTDDDYIEVRLSPLKERILGAMQRMGLQLYKVDCEENGHQFFPNSYMNNQYGFGQQNFNQLNYGNMPQQGFGNQPNYNQPGFGNQPNYYNQFGSQPPQGYQNIGGQPMHTQQSFGNNPPPQQGFGNQPFPNQPGFGNQQQQGFGNQPPIQQGFGNQPQQGFGNNPPIQNQQGFGNQPPMQNQPGFNQPGYQQPTQQNQPNPNQQGYANQPAQSLLVALNNRIVQEFEFKSANHQYRGLEELEVVFNQWSPTDLEMVLQIDRKRKGFSSGGERFVRMQINAHHFNEQSFMYNLDGTIRG